jgi:hypothetical protein
LIDGNFRWLLLQESSTLTLWNLRKHGWRRWETFLNILTFVSTICYGCDIVAERRPLKPSYCSRNYGWGLQFRTMFVFQNENDWIMVLNHIHSHVALNRCQIQPRLRWLYGDRDIKILISPFRLCSQACLWKYQIVIVFFSAKIILLVL